MPSGSRPALLTTTLFALAFLLSLSPSFAQVQGVLEVNHERLRGTNVDGFPLLFAPDPVQPGPRSRIGTPRRLPTS